MRTRTLYELLSLFLSLAFMTQGAFAQRTDKITFALGWLPTGYYAPYFVALEKGYYADANLDVTIVRGNGSGDTVNRVAAGQVDMGSADSGAVIAAKSRNEIPVKMVAIVEQSSPSGILYLEDSGIKSPADLIGKTVVRSAAGASTILLPAFLEKNGISVDQVNFVVAEPSTFLPLLLSRKADAIVEQYIVMPKYSFPAAKEGLTLKAMTYSEYGLQTYGASIIANEGMLKNNPDAVRRFLAASFKGFEAAFRNVDEAIEILRKYHPQNQHDVAATELRLEQNLVMTDDVKKTGLGYIDLDKLTRTRDFLTEALKLTNKPSVEVLHTREFLPK